MVLHNRNSKPVCSDYNDVFVRMRKHKSNCNEQKVFTSQNEISHGGFGKSGLGVDAVVPRVVSFSLPVVAPSSAGEVVVVALLVDASVVVVVSVVVASRAFVVVSSVVSSAGEVVVIALLVDASVVVVSVVVASRAFVVVSGVVASRVVVASEVVVVSAEVVVVVMIGNQGASGSGGFESFVGSDTEREVGIDRGKCVIHRM